MSVDVSIGSTSIETASNLVIALNASTDIDLSVATYAVASEPKTRFDITYDTDGDIGNTYTINKTVLSDAKLVTSGNKLSGGQLSKFHSMKFIKDDNKYHLIGYNSSSGKIVQQKDFYGTREEIILGYANSSAKTTMCNHNKELHIGTGNTSGSTTLWVGKQSYGTFGADKPKDLIMESAECVDPEGIGFFYKLVSDGTHCYGFTWDSGLLYKIQLSDGSITKVSTLGIYKQLRAIDYHDSKLWLFDRKKSDNGTIYEVDTTTLTPVRETALNDYDITGSYVTDMLISNGKLWLSHVNNNVEHADKLLWNVDIPTVSGFVDLVDRTPTTSSSHWTTIWRQLKESGTYHYYNVSKATRIIKTYPLSLIRCSNATTKVMWLCDYRKTEEGVDSGQEFQTNWYSDTLSGQGWGGYGQVGDSHGALEPACISIVPEDYDRSTRLRIICLQKDFGSAIRSIHGDANYFVLMEGHNIHRHGSLVDSSASGIHNFVGWSTTAPLIINSSNVTGHITADFDSTHFLAHTRTKASAIIKVQKSSLTTQANVLSNSLLTVTIAQVSGTSDFPDGKIHRWRFSIMYDGYQESPLSESEFLLEDGNGVVTNKDVTIVFDDKARIPKRMTHLNMYRASSVGTEDDTGFYRLIESVPIDDPRWTINDTTNTATLIIRDNYKSFQSYESRTGISEVLNNTHVYYSSCTDINNTLIMGDCHHREIDDAENYVFKSKPFRFDTVDWTSEFLKLPVTPNTLKAFNGRVYVFSDNKTIRLNPDSLVIEDIFDGGGSIDNNSVIVTEYGMFFADTNNIYVHDGQRPTAIAEPILRSDSNSLGWQDGTNTNVVLSFDGRRNSVLVFFTRGSTGYCWAFNLTRKRWDLLDAPKAYSSIIGKDGEVYISTDTGLYEYMGGTGYRSWEWESKIITMNADTQDKMFYKLRGIGDAHTLKYKTNTDSGWSGSWQNLTNEKVGTVDKKAKAIRVKIIPTGTTDEIDSVGIIYRSLPIK